MLHKHTTYFKTEVGKKKSKEKNVGPNSEVKGREVRVNAFLPENNTTRTICIMNYKYLKVQGEECHC